MSNFLKKLKTKWGIKRNIDFLLILTVFSITGSASVWVGKPILKFIAIDHLHPILYWIIRLLIIFPVYQVLLLIVAFFLGQFNFFWNFEKKMFKRMSSLFVGKK